MWTRSSCSDSLRLLALRIPAAVKRVLFPGGIQRLAGDALIDGAQHCRRHRCGLPQAFGGKLCCRGHRNVPLAALTTGKPRGCGLAHQETAAIAAFTALE